MAPQQRNNFSLLFRKAIPTPVVMPPLAPVARNRGITTPLQTDLVKAGAYVNNLDMFKRVLEMAEHQGSMPAMISLCNTLGRITDVRQRTEALDALTMAFVALRSRQPSSLADMWCSRMAQMAEVASQPQQSAEDAMRSGKSAVVYAIWHGRIDSKYNAEIAHLETMASRSGPALRSIDLGESVFDVAERHGVVTKKKIMEMEARSIFGNVDPNSSHKPNGPAGIAIHRDNMSIDDVASIYGIVHSRPQLEVVMSRSQGAKQVHQLRPWRQVASELHVRDPNNALFLMQQSATALIGQMAQEAAHPGTTTIPRNVKTLAKHYAITDPSCLQQMRLACIRHFAGEGILNQGWSVKEFAKQYGLEDNKASMEALKQISRQRKSAGQR